MNKKFKWAIPFAVMALTCGIAAGCGGHKHDYTEWGSNETQHWKQCPEDGELDANTVENHGAPNAEGKCPDCGYLLHTHSYTEWGHSFTHHWKQCPDDKTMDESTKAPHGTPNADGQCPDCGYQLLKMVNQSFKLLLRKDAQNTPVTSFDGITLEIKDGDEALEENTDYTLIKGENGVLTLQKIVAGEYSLTVSANDGEYIFSGTVNADGNEQDVVLQYNRASATAHSYLIDLNHMNDAEPYFAINASVTDGFMWWNSPVPEITLKLADEVKNSKNVKLEFNLKASSANNQPNNAFGIVMAEDCRGIALSLWNTENETDGIKLHNLSGRKLGADGYGADEAATLKWLEDAIYGENGVDIRVVRAGGTIKYFAKNADGKYICFKADVCPADAQTEIRFMGAGSDFIIKNFEVDGNYTETAVAYSATLTVLDAEENNVTLEAGAKALLISGATSYETALTANTDGTYAISGNFVPGLYTVSILGKISGYTSAEVQVGDASTTAVQLTLGDYAVATKYHHTNNHGMGECDFETLIDIDETQIKINTAEANGKVVDGFWCWNSPVPEAVLVLSDEAMNVNATVMLELNLKAATPNDMPNNAFGIVMTSAYKGVNMSFWNTTNDVDGVICRALKGCLLGNDEFSDDKDNTNDWIEVLAYGENGVNIRAIRNGTTIEFWAENTTGATAGWVKIFETTCGENDKTDIKFLGMGSDYTVSNIVVIVNPEA